VWISKRRRQPCGLEAQTSSFDEIAFWTGPFDLNFVTPDGSEKVRASYASSSLFRALRVEPHLGRGFLPEEDREQGPQVAVLSHKLWLQRFNGDPNVIGQSLTVDTYGRRSYSVIGVMPERFQFPDDTELWLPAGWNGLLQNRRAAIDERARTVEGGHHLWRRPKRR
jgi:hypothetical protein